MGVPPHIAAFFVRMRRGLCSQDHEPDLIPVPHNAAAAPRRRRRAIFFFFDECHWHWQ
jgi:hypothetical protein